MPSHSVEIRTSGDYAHRRTTIEDARDTLGATSMTKGVLSACEHATHDVKNKRKALNYLETHVAGKHVEKVAELLSTPHVICHGETRTTVEPEANL